MKMEDRQAFYAAWIQACEPYGRNFVPTPSGLEFIFGTLFGYELSDIIRGLRAHALSPEEGRFAPKPADIVRHIVGDSGSVAQLAWTKFMGALERVGPYASVVFDDPLIMATIRDMGGWLELSKMTNDEEPYLQNEFCTRYRGYLNSPPASYPTQFIGIENNELAKVGVEQKSPVLIGDPQKCLMVYRTGSSQKTGQITLAQYLKSTASTKALGLSEKQDLGCMAENILQINHDHQDANL